MHRRSIALLAFGLGMLSAPVIAIVMSHTTGTAIAQDEELARVRPKSDDLDPKEVYLELIKSKLSLMTPEELQHETDALRGELFELQATEKLREAERKLEEVIEQHPQTMAAQRARNMLKNSERAGANPQRDELFGPPEPFAAPARRGAPASTETVRPRRRTYERDTTPARTESPLEGVPLPDDESR
ncbi:hypothetical protein [Schlesneria paludicola]|uniref:hypothetical protein n=1 Tax=Schlesneria paludicola TaxID=360056 RepID=UPI00029A38A0|nr:hypothetical protein [Schlesneria paludicola]